MFHIGDDLVADASARAESHRLGRIGKEPACRAVSSSCFRLGGLNAIILA